MADPQHIKITLNADGVLAPALRAIRNSVEVASFCLNAIESSDLSETPKFEPTRFHMRFSGEMSADLRKVTYTNCLLSKGFQELARGIRLMLEEAYFYNSMVEMTKAGIPATWSALQEQMQEFRTTAMRANFPDLMRRVNAGLSAPLHFENEFLTLQTVRNCLEHRDGIVTEKDLDPTTKTLRLLLPQIKIFIEKEGREVEIGKGSFVEADTAIMIRNTVKEREYKLGERVIFKAEEFHDIGFGCWAFTSDLGTKLPKLDKDVSNQAELR
jgi:hypothetical protein